jgi:hypothetical protein
MKENSVRAGMSEQQEKKDILTPDEVGDLLGHPRRINNWNSEIILCISTEWTALDYLHGSTSSLLETCKER